MSKYREIIRGKDGGDELRLNFHIGQKMIMLSKARFPVLLGGSQSGKTCLAPDWLEREIRRRGPGDYLAITATFPLLNLKLLPEFRYVFESLYQYGEYKQQRGSHIISFFRGSQKGKVLFSDEDYEREGVQETRIIFGSATNPESIESATAKAAVLDECVAPETWIDTEVGKLPISDIVNNRIDVRVWSYNTDANEWQLKPILRWIKLPQTKPLISFGDLRITGNHKVWSNREIYISVDDLITSTNYCIMKVEVMEYGKAKTGALFYRYVKEDERSCEESFGRTQFESFSQSEETLSGASRTQTRNIRETEKKVFQSEKSSVGSGWRGPGRTYAYFSEDGFSPNETERIMELRRKWTTKKLAAREIGGGIGMGERICCDNRQWMASPCLQDRCRRPRVEDSDRSGKSSKLSQTRMVYSQWMDVSSLLKQNGRDLDGGLSEDGCVYNLEVEGNHNYIANGILVSNCGQKQWKRDSWEATLRRLSLAKGRALLITTLYGYGWLKTEVYDEWKKGNPDFDVVQIDSIVNPAFPKEEYERARKSMPSWKFDLFYRGRYSKPAGMVYDCLDSDNIVDDFPIPENWLFYTGHDFGTNNMSGVWLAQNPATSDLYICKEYLAGGLATFEHVDKWKQMSVGLRIVKRSGGAPGEDGWRGDFSQGGWQISKPMVSGVDEGIQKVYGLLKTKRLHIFRSCIGVLDDFYSYSYDLDENYNPTGKIVDKERYHYADDVRYVCADFNPIDTGGEIGETRWDDGYEDERYERRLARTGR